MTAVGEPDAPTGAGSPGIERIVEMKGRLRSILNYGSNMSRRAFRWLRSSPAFAVAILLLLAGGLLYSFCRSFESGVSVLVALGTLIVAFVAVFGDWIRSRIIPPKLVLSLRPPTLTEVRNATQDKVGMAWYFGLDVRNLRPWRKATNCRVVLTALHRACSEGRVEPEPMSIPLPFHWAVVPVAPLYLSVTSQGEVVNFGVLQQGKDFEPVLISRTLNFRHTVRANETAWFSVQIRADDLISEHCQVFKVFWDGQWSDDSKEISSRVQICEVSAQEVGARVFGRGMTP
jgi:hypothetical protein